MPEKKWNSTKLWLTVYSLVLFPFLLWHGKITGEHFVSLFPLCLGLYCGANVWATREQANSQTAIIKAKGEQNGSIREPDNQ
jgi:hypothetical protein